jgi:predicted AAA+ superfamily ATPase
MKLKRDEGYMKEILAFIVNTQGVPVSWLNISRETSIASLHTTQAYVEDLKNMFVVEILNFLSPNGKVVFRKNRKIHIADPFLYKTICEYTRTQANEGTLLEATVATHLSRKYDTFYWKNRSEVDIVVKLNGKQIGIEVKKGFQTWRRPSHLAKAIILKKEDIPLFLASFK